MRIQHNIAALNSHRQLGNNNNAVSKNLEKLSSGYRINRAGDDAAGLAISEKMRAQITGLETAQKNANDGISLIQTAEGALTEVHSMLNRMVELTEQSANGTYQNAVDRENLQKEMNSLRDEIDRISEGTNFNGINLLDGSLSGTSASGGMTGSVIAKYKGAEVAPVAGADASASAAAATKATYDIDFAGLSATSGQTVIYNGVTATEGATAGFAAANTAADNAKAIADAWKADAKFGNYDIAVNGTKVTLTAKTAGVDSNAATMNTTMTGNATITSKNVTETVEGANAIGIDYFEKDTVNIDGVDVKVDWSKLSDSDRQLLEKNWTATDGTVTAEDAKKAAKVLQDTINSSIQDHNKANGTALNEIKVTETGADNAAKSFSFTSGQKDGNSKISFAGQQGTVLGQIFGAGNQVDSAAPIRTLSISPQDVNGKFTLKIDDQDVEVDLNGLTLTSTSDDLLNALNGAINTALINYDTAQGNTGADALAGKINVKFDADGALEFTNTTGKKIAFEDKNGGEVAKTLGISNEGKSIGNGGLTLQIGDTAESFNQLTVSINSMSTNALGLSGINIGTQAGAAAALDKIKAAINTVSSTRGDLGAIQNRLEHTINNLSVTAENMTAAESRIRDVDMAEEMMNFTKNNILTQASQAMLAQANQLPQGVLQLLQ